MNLRGPDRYNLTFDANAFAVLCAKGTAHFSGIANWRKPKLYIVSVEDRPIYVGITRQPLRNRLRFGWKAAGDSGYYGYSWRHELTEADIDVWCHTDPSEENPDLDLETVEAEVVFLIRSAGQWPAHQTEIHFHQLSAVHRAAAASIVSHYKLAPNPVLQRTRQESARR